MGVEENVVFKTLDDVMNFNKANVDAFVQCGSRLAAGVEEITKEMVGYSGKAFDDVVEGSRAFTGCKSPSDVAQLQQQLMQKSWDMAMAQTSKMSSIGASVAQSSLEPIQDFYRSAMSQKL